MSRSEDDRSSVKWPDFPVARLPDGSLKPVTHSTNVDAFPYGTEMWQNGTLLYRLSPERDGFFSSPEQAAVASFPAAQARPISVELSGDEAVVVVDTEPSHPVSLRCGRRERGWEYMGMRTSD